MRSMKRRSTSDAGTPWPRSSSRRSRARGAAAWHAGTSRIRACRKSERFWFPIFFEPTTMSCVSRSSSAVGTKSRSIDRSMSTDTRNGCRARRTNSRKASPTPRLRQVEERHLPEAARQVGAERGGRVGRAVRADQDLVPASQPVQERDQTLGVRDEDGLLVVHRDADGERRHGAWLLLGEPLAGVLRPRRAGEALPASRATPRSRQPARRAARGRAPDGRSTPRPTAPPGSDRAAAGRPPRSSSSRPCGRR